MILLSLKKSFTNLSMEIKQKATLAFKGVDDALNGVVVLLPSDLSVCTVLSGFLLVAVDVDRFPLNNYHKIIFSMLAR